MSHGNKAFYYDISEFEDSCAAIALNSNYLQVDKGQVTILHHNLFLEDLTLRRLQLSHTMFEEFTLEPGWTTLVLTSAVDHTAVWNGVHSFPDALGIIHPEKEHEVLMPTGWSTIEIDIKDQLLEREGLLTERALTDAKVTQKALFSINRYYMEKIRKNLVSLFDNNSLFSEAVLKEEPKRALRRHVLDLLAEAVAASNQELLPRATASTVQAYRVVQKARTFFDDQLTANPGIESIALELGVTTRTLQRSFISVLGISPKQYLLARKLDVARRDLRQSGRHKTVSDVAYDFGFVSSARFVEQYHRQFGHTPAKVFRLNQIV